MAAGTHPELLQTFHRLEEEKQFELLCGQAMNKYELELLKKNYRATDKQLTATSKVGCAAAADQRCLPNPFCCSFRHRATPPSARRRR